MIQAFNCLPLVQTAFEHFQADNNRHGLNKSVMLGDSTPNETHWPPPKGIKSPDTRLSEVKNSKYASF